MAPGARLASSRELTRRYGVGPVTLSRAVARLVAEDALATRPGAGTFVGPRRTTASATGPIDTSWQTLALGERRLDDRAVLDALRPPPANTISLAGGYLHRALQPTKAMSAAWSRVGRRAEIWERAPQAGLDALRAIFARIAGGEIGADDVLVTGGGQNALAIACRAIEPPGRAVLVESPTYPGALAAIRGAGLRPVPVPIDEEGIRPDLLAEAFGKTAARVLYCQPTFHNPTGVVLGADRRREVIEVARAAGAFIIEDDSARHLAHGGHAPRPLIAADPYGTVIYVCSLTKPASPSLRVGALIARGPVMQRLRATRLVEDFFVPRPLQELAIELLSGGAWERHLQTLSAVLRERCAILAAEIARAMPDWRLTRMPAGGLHLWMQLPREIEGLGTPQAFGVAVGQGSAYFAAEPPGTFLRIGFAGAADERELIEATRRLRAIWNHARPRSRSRPASAGAGRARHHGS
jgi:DNA-binding transcriptional MocR family regulator